MPPNRFESEVESFLEGSHGDRTHIKRADHPRLHHYAGRYLVGVCWASFFAEEPLEAPCWANLFAEESLKALMVNVCMCARSPCGCLSSPGDKFRMQFPSRYFKL